VTSGADGEIGDLLSAYAFYFDTRDVDSLLSEIFTADAVWASPYSGDRAGAAELRALFEGSMQAVASSSHFVGPVRINSSTETSASTTTYFQSDVIYADAPTTGRSRYHLDVGYYRDAFARGERGWRIARREVVLLMPTRIVAFEYASGAH
jgi:ketosteroid isomerase-like protein